MSTRISNVDEAIAKYFDGNTDKLDKESIKQLFQSKKITAKVGNQLMKQITNELHECDITKIQNELTSKKDDVKRLNKLLRECKSKEYTYGKDRITMNELLDIIKKENKDNVKDLLDLFPTTSERVEGVNVTRNHVYEALWIICYAKDLPNDKPKQFYKSLENGEAQSYEDVMDGQVNSGNDGGIADLYFELVTDPTDKDNKVNKVNCGPDGPPDIVYPHCENKTIQSYDKYLFSSKFYRKTKGVTNYDIQDIFTEAVTNGLPEFNIVLLVQDKHELLKKMDTSNKALSNLCHEILDIDDLDLHYKHLLYDLKNKKAEVKKLGVKKIVPRFHQNYFIRYSQSCMKQYKTKNFVWGAVPRSGKSFMIGGLIAEEKPKIVILYLGAISETKEQFIEMFNDFGDFSDYEIHDLQKKELLNKGKSKKIIIVSQEKGRMDLENKIIKYVKDEKDKMIFFDEIHQGSGPASLQEEMLDTIVFDNPYKAFIMVTATFAKPYLKYINKGDIEGRLIQWRYDDIHLMKTIDKKVKDDDTGIDTLITYGKIKTNILEENDGDEKLKIFDILLKEENERGIDLSRLAKQYDKYPELIVSTPIIDETMINDPDGFIVNGNIAVDKIFKPLMKKTPSDWGTAAKFVEYIRKYIYEKYIILTLNHGSTLLKPHSELWFLPTIFRSEKGDTVDVEEKGNGFRYMTQNFTKILMDNPWFSENYCIAILHSVGFDKTEIDFIDAQKKGAYKVKWSDASVNNTGNSYCISTICPGSKGGVKKCLLKQEACAKANGKSLIILTGKMLRLGVSLPCVDIALHMDPIKSVDTIYQSMFRVLTERDGKTAGIFIDMLTTRQITFMYEYMNYISNTKNTLSTEKKMKKLLEKLLLFNFNGINFQKGDDYQMIYNDLMKDFSLNDVTSFKNNSKKIDLNDVNELVRSLDEEVIIGFHQLLETLNINYKSVKKPKAVKKQLKDREGNEMDADDYRMIIPAGNVLPVKIQENPELKQKYDEVSSFINDMIVLFALFSTDDYETNISKDDIVNRINTFFTNDIADIKDFCDNLAGDELSVIDCHLMNVIKNSVKGDELHGMYYELKNNLMKIFNETILNEGGFYKIFVSNIEDMKKLKKAVTTLKTKGPCAEDFIKDEKVLEIIRKRLTVREEEKNLYGEVFTPIELICEMFSHIPDDVWKNPNLKWLDPANGIGNFPVVAYYKLMDSLKDVIPQETHRSRHIIEKMLYMVELNPVNVRVCKKIFKMIDPKATPNIVKHDFLAFKGFRGIDKFDVIMGNPPFQKPQEGKRESYGGKTLWDKFIVISLNLLNNNGYLGFINPPMWRRPDSELWEQMISKNNLLFIRILNTKTSKELFNVGQKIDIYVIKKGNKLKMDSKIIDGNNDIHYFNIERLPFLPNSEYTSVEKIITKNRGINVIYGSNTYETRAKKNKKGDIIGAAHPHMSINKTKTHKYPIVHTMNNKGIGYWYTDDPKRVCSAKDKRIQFVPKVILNFNSNLYPLNDYNGEYGMSQNSFGIPINSKVMGEMVIRALKNKGFEKILNACRWGSQDQTDYRLFKYFKPDFYKHFLGKHSSKDPEIVASKKEESAEKVSLSAEPVVPAKKSKCSKAHPEAPCSGDKPREKNGCCYKDSKQSPKPKQTKKKSKNSGGSKHTGGGRKNRFRKTNRKFKTNRKKNRKNKSKRRTRMKR